ncbi:MAG: hypothetical protein ACP5VR_13535 [Acidimicrobiales bacterium]
MSLALWQLYWEALASELSGTKVMIVHYEDLVADPMTKGRELARLLAAAVLPEERGALLLRRNSELALAQELADERAVARELALRSLRSALQAELDKRLV